MLAASAGFQLLEEYDRFWLGVVQNADLPRLVTTLRGAGLSSSLPPYDLLFPASGSFDVRDGVPTTREPKLRFTQADPPDLWIVQFVGPPKPAWIQPLTDSLTVVFRMDSNAVLVSGSEGAMDALAGEVSIPASRVQAVVPFHPEMRVSSALWNAIESGSPARVLATQRGLGSAQLLRAELEAAGFSTVETERTLLGRDIVGVAGTAKLFQELLFRNDILSLEPIPNYAPSDEKSSLVLSTPSQPASGSDGYRDWLRAAEAANDCSACLLPTTPDGLTVAVVDTGVDFSGLAEVCTGQWPDSDLREHPSLEESSVSSFVFARYRAENGQTPTGTEEGGGDCFGHGTMVATILAGASLGETDREGFHPGIGVAPGIGVYSVKKTASCYPVAPPVATDQSAALGKPADASGVALSLSGMLDGWLGSTSLPDDIPITTNSWNDTADLQQGLYTTDAAEIDLRSRGRLGAASQEMLFFFSAGNVKKEGGVTADFSEYCSGTPAWDLAEQPGGAIHDHERLYVRPPATAKNAIAVGAAGSLRDVEDHVAWPASGSPLDYLYENQWAWQENGLRDSSDSGTTLHDRARFSPVGTAAKSCNGVADCQRQVKPDLLAPAARVFGGKSRNCRFPYQWAGIRKDEYLDGVGFDMGFGLDGPDFTTAAGTSFAAPQAAGAAALATRYFRWRIENPNRRDDFSSTTAVNETIRPFPSPDLLKASLVAHARSMAGGRNTWVGVAGAPAPVLTGSCRDETLRSGAVAPNSTSAGGVALASLSFNQPASVPNTIPVSQALLSFAFAAPLDSSPSGYRLELSRGGRTLLVREIGDPESPLPTHDLDVTDLFNDPVHGGFTTPGSPYVATWTCPGCTSAFTVQSPRLRARYMKTATKKLNDASAGVEARLGQRPEPFQGWGELNLGEVPESWSQGRVAGPGSAAAEVPGVSGLFDPTLTRAFVNDIVLDGANPEFSRCFVVADGNRPVAISLAWIDYPKDDNFGTSTNFLVSDLDLEVVVDGVRYIGNCYDRRDLSTAFAGESARGSNCSFDRFNNLETVHLGPGQYSTGSTVEVSVRPGGIGIRADAVGLDPEAAGQQDFGLYATNLVLATAPDATVVCLGGGEVRFFTHAEAMPAPDWKIYGAAGCAGAPLDNFTGVSPTRRFDDGDYWVTVTGTTCGALTTSSCIQFEVGGGIPAATVTSVVPPSGPVGTIITLNGTVLTSVDEVLLSMPCDAPVLARLLTADDDSISFAIPAMCASSGTVDIALRTSGGCARKTLERGFALVEPGVVVASAPYASTTGGKSIRFFAGAGCNLSTVTGVTIGGASAQAVTVVDASRVDVVTGASASEGVAAVSMSGTSGTCSLPLFEYVQFGFATDQTTSGKSLALFRSGPPAAMSGRMALDGRPFPNVALSDVSDAQIVPNANASKVLVVEHSQAIRRFRTETESFDIRYPAVGCPPPPYQLWSPKRLAVDPEGVLAFVLHDQYPQGSVCGPGPQVFAPPPISVLRLSASAIDPANLDANPATDDGILIDDRPVSFEVPFPLAVDAVARVERFTGASTPECLPGNCVSGCPGFPPAQLAQPNHWRNVGTREKGNWVRRFLVVVEATPSTSAGCDVSPYCQFFPQHCPVGDTCMPYATPIQIAIYDLNPSRIQLNAQCLGPGIPCPIPIECLVPNEFYRRRRVEMWFDQVVFWNTQDLEFGLELASPNTWDDMYLVAPNAGKLLKASASGLLDAGANSLVSGLPQAQGVSFSELEAMEMLPTTVDLWPKGPTDVVVMTDQTTGLETAYVSFGATDEIQSRRTASIATSIRTESVDPGSSDIALPVGVAARDQGDRVFTANFGDGTVSAVESDLRQVNRFDVGTKVERIAIQSEVTASRLLVPVVPLLAGLESSSFDSEQHQVALVRSTNHLLDVVSRQRAAPSAVRSLALAIARDVERWLVSGVDQDSVLGALREVPQIYSQQVASE